MLHKLGSSDALTVLRSFVDEAPGVGDPTEWVRSRAQARLEDLDADAATGEDITVEEPLGANVPDNLIDAMDAGLVDAVDAEVEAAELQAVVDDDMEANVAEVDMGGLDPEANDIEEDLGDANIYAETGAEAASDAEMSSDAEAAVLEEESAHEEVAVEEEEDLDPDLAEHEAAFVGCELPGEVRRLVEEFVAENVFPVPIHPSCVASGLSRLTETDKQGVERGTNTMLAMLRHMKKNSSSITSPNNWLRKRVGQEIKNTLTGRNLASHASKGGKSSGVKSIPLKAKVAPWRVAPHGKGKGCGPRSRADEQPSASAVSDPDGGGGEVPSSQETSLRRAIARLRREGPLTLGTLGGLLRLRRAAFEDDRRFHIAAPDSHGQILISLRGV